MLHSRLRLSFGASLELGLCMGEGAPPETQALVVPQDVHLLLGEAAPLEDHGDSPEHAARRAAAAEPRAPGALVVRAGRPLLLQAVVYDFVDSRAGKHAQAFLGEWSGTLVCDDFSGYKGLFRDLSLIHI